MSRFIPPFSLGGFKPSPATLSEFIYQIWVYLQQNPIMPEDEINQQIADTVPEAVKEYVEENPELSNTIAEIVDNYIRENPPESPVQSVNSQTGDVVIDYKSLVPENIQIPVFIHSASAIPDNTTIIGLRKNGYRFTFNSTTARLSVINANYTLTEVTAGDVLSVNNKTGAVVLTAADILIDPDDGDTNVKDLYDMVSALQNTVDSLLGVGAIYITKSATFNPNTAFPGTWQRIEHAMIYGAGANDTVNDTVLGSATHQLTASELPANLGSFRAYAYSSFFPHSDDFVVAAQSGTATYSFQTGTAIYYGDYNLGGDGAPMDIMPPYLYRYIWERTA